MHIKAHDSWAQNETCQYTRKCTFYQFGFSKQNGHSRHLRSLIRVHIWHYRNTGYLDYHNSAKWRIRSDCAIAQSDLILHSACRDIFMIHGLCYISIVHADNVKGKNAHGQIRKLVTDTIDILLISEMAEYKQGNQKEILQTISRRGPQE